MNENTVPAVLSLGATVITPDGRTGIVDRFGFNTETGMADRSLVRVVTKSGRCAWCDAADLTRTK